MDSRSSSLAAPAAPSSQRISTQANYPFFARSNASTLEAAVASSSVSNPEIFIQTRAVADRTQGTMRHLCTKMFRTKTVNEEFMDTQLKRCLNTFDISLLGVGHMIGAGIYVLTGAVARDSAGPGIVLSFIIAGFASLLAALCYAEFGARVPKAGSAYTYTYVTVGELWAFVIGWNIILEHMIGAAAVARSWSGYFDSLLNNVIQNGTLTYIGGFHKHDAVRHIVADYPDFIAFLAVIVVCCFMAVGAKTSTMFNSVFTIINLCVITFVTIYGLILAEGKNWTAGAGFLPFGFAGVMKGAATCFFAYIGFDSIATAGEEAAKPSRSIPIATFVSMSIVTVCYVLMSAAVTLMLPYNQIHPTAAFSDAFEQRNIIWAKYVVAAGALSGMTTSLVGSLFALPRCVYAMASDGLIFRSLAFVSEKTQVPTLAVGVFGSLCGLIALFFDIETLVEFMSIGTLLAYTIVSCCVIILRYSPTTKVATTQSVGERGESREGFATNPMEIDSTSLDEDDTTGLTEDRHVGTLKAKYRALKPFLPQTPGRGVSFAIFTMTVSMLCIGIFFNYGNLLDGTWYTAILFVIFIIVAVLSFALVCMHHQSTAGLRFKVPFVPLLPAASVMINIILMMHLSPMTWLRLLVWLAIGFLIYFLYGMRHSTENTTPKREYSNLLSITQPSVTTPTSNPQHTQPDSLSSPYDWPEK